VHAAAASDWPADLRLFDTRDCQHSYTIMSDEVHPHSPHQPNGLDAQHSHGDASPDNHHPQWDDDEAEQEEKALQRQASQSILLMYLMMLYFGTQPRNLNHHFDQCDQDPVRRSGIPAEAGLGGGPLAAEL
jgi:hypothetical protein